MAMGAEVPLFSTHTTRHLCLTDLARTGWELHASPHSRDTADRHHALPTSTCPAESWPTSSPRGMDQIHAWRVRRC